MTTKRLGGFSNIHIAKLTNDTTWSAPTPLSGAKSIDVSLKYDTVQFYADNAMDFNDYIFTGGDGKLTVSGLTMDEYQSLFGSQVANGGVLVKANDQLPELALLFERNKVDGSGKVLYVVYACKCSPVSISGKTNEGKVDEETVEVDFTVRALADNSVYYMVDSAIADAATVSGFYTAVVKPV